MIALAIALTLAFLWVVFFLLHLLNEEGVKAALIGATYLTIAVAGAAAAMYGLALLWERALA